MRKRFPLLLFFLTLCAVPLLLVSFTGGQAAGRVLAVSSPMRLTNLPIDGTLVARTPTRWPSPIAPSPTVPTRPYCPIPTPELPPQVDPVTSPTNLLTQVIQVRGRFDQVWVESESGTFSGGTDVEIALLPGVTHHLVVTGHVPNLSDGGCHYGNYTLRTDIDVNRSPLVIVQAGAPVDVPNPPLALQPRLFLPLLEWERFDGPPK